MNLDLFHLKAYISFMFGALHSFFNMKTDFCVANNLVLVRKPKIGLCHVTPC